MEDPPAFDPERTRGTTASFPGLQHSNNMDGQTLVDSEILHKWHGWSQQWSCHGPGAVGDEDALSDGQRAVVPDQQEVKEGV